MNVKTQKEIKSLDDDLKLFDDDTWDFFGGVIDTKEENYEYFNDIRDTSFDKKSGSKLKTFVCCSLIAFSFIALSLAALHYSGVLNRKDYNAVSDMKSSNEGVMTNYISGDIASNDDLIEISDVLSSYFRVLKAENSYDDLYDYCNLTSTFADTYSSFTSKIKTSYDLNDCYARSLREFGGMCSLVDITKVIVKDDIYYCYAEVSIPSSSEIYEYVYQNQYNMIKHFKSTQLSEENMIKYLLSATNVARIPTSNQEILIKMKCSSNGFKIVDDSCITSSCIDAYTETINQMTRVLNNTLSN